MLCKRLNCLLFVPNPGYAFCSKANTHIRNISGKHADITWADTYVRVTISKVQSISSKLLKSDLPEAQGEAREIGLFIEEYRKHRAWRKRKEVPAGNFRTFGVMLSRLMGHHSPEFVARQAIKYRSLFDQHGLMSPVATLHRTDGRLEELRGLRDSREAVRHGQEGPQLPER